MVRFYSRVVIEAPSTQLGFSCRTNLTNDVVVCTTGEERCRGLSGVGTKTYRHKEKSTKKAHQGDSRIAAPAGSSTIPLLQSIPCHHSTCPYRLTNHGPVIV